MAELLALMALALVAGLVSFTSPCTLPLLPGYVSYVSGLTPPESGTRLPSAARRRTLTAAVLFVVGFAAVFTALGASASALGFLLDGHRRLLTIVGGIVILVMGIAMTGLVRVPLLHREARLNLSRFGSGPASALPLGAAFAFGWTPCVGPVLASILTTAATTTTVARGAVLLLTYSFGLGLPFVALAVGMARGRGRLRWLRRNSRRIEIAGGIVLAAMGIALLTGEWTALMSRLLAGYAQLGWPPI